MRKVCEIPGSLLFREVPEAIRTGAELQQWLRDEGVQTDAVLVDGLWTPLSGMLRDQEFMYVRSAGKSDLAMENSRLQATVKTLEAKCELLEAKCEFERSYEQIGKAVLDKLLVPDLDWISRSDRFDEIDVSVKLRSDTGLVSSYTKPRGTKFGLVMEQFLKEHDLPWEGTGFFLNRHFMSPDEPVDVVNGKEVFVATEDRMPPEPPRPLNEWTIVCRMAGQKTKFHHMHAEPRKELTYRAVSELMPASSYSYMAVTEKFRPLEASDFGPFEGSELPLGFPDMLVVAENKRKHDEEDFFPSKMQSPAAVCT